MGFLPKPHHLHLVIRKTDKSRQGTVYRITGQNFLTLSKSRKTGKDSETVTDHRRLGRHKTKCNVAVWTES